MRDLFDDFMEELRRREAIARGQDPDAAGSRDRGSNRQPDDTGDEDEPSDERRRRARGHATTTPTTPTRRPTASRRTPRTTRIASCRCRSPTIAVAADHRVVAVRAVRTTAAPSRAARAGRRLGIGVVIVAILAVILLFSVGIDLWTDALWFKSVGFDSVFWTRLVATFGLGVGAFVIAAIVFLGNLWIAGRLTPPPSADGAGSLRSLVDRINDAAQAADERRSGGRSQFGGRDRFGNQTAGAVDLRRR